MSGIQARAGSSLLATRRRVCCVMDVGCLHVGTVSFSVSPGQVTELIGSGSYGSVCEAEDSMSGQRLPGKLSLIFLMLMLLDVALLPWRAKRSLTKSPETQGSLLPLRSASASSRTLLIASAFSERPSHVRTCQNPCWHLSMTCGLAGEHPVQVESQEFAANIHLRPSGFSQSYFACPPGMLLKSRTSTFQANSSPLQLPVIEYTCT